MPELACEACKATWTAGVEDLLRSDYWPATLHFATIYATDVFFSFEEMKMAAPGLSCQAFLRMLDQRTVRFGRVSIEVISPSWCFWFVRWKAYVLIIYFLNIISCWCPFSVIDWEDLSWQLYKKFLWMGGCAIWGGQHLQGGALHLSCVQPGYACCFCGWKLQALPF